MTKRYLLFYGRQYYPLGGWEDFITSFDEVSDALTYLGTHSNFDWFQVVDADTGKIVVKTP
jgi:hypothetical protein